MDSGFSGFRATSGCGTATGAVCTGVGPLSNFFSSASSAFTFCNCTKALMPQAAPIRTAKMAKNAKVVISLTF